jgi:hypothetical protein
MVGYALCVGAYIHNKGIQIIDRAATAAFAFAFAFAVVVDDRIGICSIVRARKNSIHF